MKRFVKFNTAPVINTSAIIQRTLGDAVTYRRGFSTRDVASYVDWKSGQERL